jgi:hypothetical protein
VLELGTDAAVLDAPSAATGLVGMRQLVCVQTFDLARLTSHPVELIPGSFVAVGGRGPRGDSNESGKTSFLAATSLLLGDPEWRMTGGGPAATASLLFEPETAGVSAHSYAPARQGYVIGVFADAEQPTATALTVWCRINATAEYFQVRYADGVHLVRGDSDLERHAAADAGWAAMPTATQLGARNYAERLYGDSPRCLAYVAERGKQKSAPSLLQMNAGGFTPEQIGDDLIRLTGRASAFENEGQQRQRLDESQRTLTDKQRGHERISRDEDEQLTGVQARNRSRHQLGEAERIWQLHFARGLLDVLDREAQLSGERDQADEDVRAHQLAVEEAQTEVTTLSVPDDLARRLQAANEQANGLKQRLREAEQKAMTARHAAGRAHERVNELEASADGYSGPPAADVQATLTAAESGRDGAREQLGLARGRRDDAQRRVRAAESGAEGRAGELTALLAEYEIAAAPLMDVELADLARAAWEPRLALFEHAVVIAPGAITDALVIAETVPGAVLIAGDEHTELPAGVTSAPAGSAGFLARLAERTITHASPERTEHAELGVTVVGGFAEPQTGRAARLERAQAALARAEQDLADAQAALRRAELAVEVARGELARAEAADKLPDARATLRESERASAARAREVTELEAPLRDAETERDDAAADVRSYERALSAAIERLEARAAKHQAAVTAARDAQKALDNLQVEYWRSNWGGTTDAATAALTEEPRSEKRLRNHAAELLQDSLSALSIHPDGTGAPTPELEQVAQRRSLVFEDPDRGRVPATLAEVARPLGDFLDAHHDQDLLIEDRITRARAQREEELSVAGDECERLDRALQTLQDGVEQRIRSALEAISDQYDRLNRESGWFGADLRIEARRPEGPEERWRWLVTPRWRRSDGGRMLPYDNQANTAQKKLATVQLVLAALLAAPNPRGRVLVLDELGDSLGVSHRREVLREIAATANAKGVTVLGTCQDSVLGDASGFCGELVYFEYPSHAEALNRPTRMFAFDDNRKRVELTEHYLRDGRPWL